MLLKLNRDFECTQKQYWGWGGGGVFGIKRLTNDTQLVPGSEDPT